MVAYTLDLSALKQRQSDIGGFEAKPCFKKKKRERKEEEKLESAAAVS